jgi:uncharacterized protein (TIGR02246 family)
VTAGADVLGPVEAHLAAFNERDVDAVMALFAEDAVFATADQLVVGRRGLRALFGDSFAAPVTAALELRRAVVAGDTAACELVERLTLPSGETTELDVAAFYTVRDGALVRVRVYRDLPG